MGGTVQNLVLCLENCKDFTNNNLYDISNTSIFSDDDFIDVLGDDGKLHYTDRKDSRFMFVFSATPDVVNYLTNKYGEIHTRDYLN